MLELEQIEKFYPEHLRPFRKNLLREYLQFRILEAIFDSDYCGRLAFMGGTAIHILHQGTRFSEDLDFDNLGLTKQEFEDLSSVVAKRLKREGYTLETRNVFRGAFRSYIKFQEILLRFGISRHADEKMLIQIDAEPQKFDYIPEKAILNKFDIFIRVNAVPVGMLLSQKIAAILKRKRPVGRDFYDAVYLFGRTEPDFKYLEAKAGVADIGDLKEILLKRAGELDIESLARDVEPFLYRPGDSK
ncbi:MAG: nucleotidyl transferase AbiEii/AbiGii toxin family protein, partial [Deltaproteobacteria bacterium]|nr:nucleotidyl transferase AbiEii/AbiGii toxin family protein [Deltaproteobacteria bacterium]